MCPPRPTGKSKSDRFHQELRQNRSIHTILAEP